MRNNTGLIFAVIGMGVFIGLASALFPIRIMGLIFLCFLLLLVILTRKFTDLIFFLVPILPAYWAIELSPTLPLITASRVLILILFGIFLFKGLRIRDLRAVTYGKFFLLYFLFLVVSTIFSLDKTESIKAIISVVLEGFFFCYLAYFLLNGKSEIEHFFKILIYASFVLCVLGIFEYASNINLFTLLNTNIREGAIDSANYIRLGVRRVTTSFPHPIAFALYLSLIFPITFALANYTKVISEKIFFYVIFGFQLVNIYLTLSRWNLVCALVVLLLLILKTLPGKKKIFYISMIIFMVIALVAVSLSGAGSGSNKALLVFSSLFGGDLEEFGRNANPYVYRFLIITEGLKASLDTPFFGRGLATNRNNMLASLPVIDNFYIQNILEIGYIGLLLVVLFQISLIRLCSSLKNTEYNYLVAPLKYSFIGYFMALISTGTLGTEKLFWLLVAVVFAIKFKLTKYSVL